MSSTAGYFWQKSLHQQTTLLDLSGKTLEKVIQIKCQLLTLTFHRISFFLEGFKKRVKASLYFSNLRECHIQEIYIWIKNQNVPNSFFTVKRNWAKLTAICRLETKKIVLNLSPKFDLTEILYEIFKLRFWLKDHNGVISPLLSRHI